MRYVSLGLLRVIVVLFAFGACGKTASADDANALALAVKATFLYKFEPFITWPPQAFSSPGSPFNLCVVGDDPFGPMLDRATSGQQTAGHAIAVLRLKTVSPDAHCQLLYVATADAVSAREAETAVAGMAVLTVTDSMEDGSAKGMINFVVADNRVRFQIDDAAATQSGLTISSKLLSLAVSVRSGP